MELLNNSVTPKTQQNLAKQLGLSEDTLQNYKKLNDLIPELQSLVEMEVINILANQNNLGLKTQQEIAKQY